MKTQVVRQYELKISPTVLSRVLSCIVALLFPFVLLAQPSATLSYDIVDSVSINTVSGKVRLWIGFSKLDPIGSSVIIYDRGDKKMFFKDLLQPYRLKEKGMGGYTYGGYTVYGTTVAFCQIDAFHVDSLYLDFSGPQPTFAKLVRRGYKKEYENFQIVPRKQISILDYLRSTEKERALATRTQKIAWRSPLGTGMADYTVGGSWLPNYLICDTVSLAHNKHVYVGFDKRDWCTVMLYEQNGYVENFRNILHPNIDSVEKNSPDFGIRCCKMTGDIISFVQRYDQCYDSIFIDFSSDIPYYQNIVHGCIGADRKERVLMTPRKKVPVSEVRTLNGDIYVYPSDKKYQLFNFQPSGRK